MQVQRAEGNYFTQSPIRPTFCIPNMVQSCIGVMQNQVRNTITRARVRCLHNSARLFIYTVKINNLFSATVIIIRVHNNNIMSISVLVNYYSGRYTLSRTATNNFKSIRVADHDTSTIHPVLLYEKVHDISLHWVHYQHHVSFALSRMGEGMEVSLFLLHYVQLYLSLLQNCLGFHCFLEASHSEHTKLVSVQGENVTLMVIRPTTHNVRSDQPFTYRCTFILTLLNTIVIKLFSNCNPHAWKMRPYANYVTSIVFIITVIK